jgi:hypothetical protein
MGFIEGKLWRPTDQGKAGFFEQRLTHLGGTGVEKRNLEFAKSFKIGDKKILTQVNPGIIDRVTYR